ncbi:MAG: bifunctional DNA-binding transcriptional regulator/O6-methylguanine-DNA methyltransferase Ada [Chloroflexaceae bacterium]|nr:bifunctional DNA-binding transcriptional regulator/O6-methylguanine-DNA methyltransferase Ada [Chloroflexaceae bacterium]NJO06225.1 bifunctional DNA-binding transcriptional regulator/O6-methylguanine-DNA methyltransferase Ada [Chloroflexaceae bacterium]
MSHTPTTEQQWQAVLDRDTSADFVYAVRSTGIYCRPACPSRRPRRDNVQFYADPAAAERAGYRACLRCQPQADEPMTALVRQVCQAIEAQINAAGATGPAPTLEELGSRFNRSQYHLQRIFKRVMGVTPRQYADAYRLQQFKAHVKETSTVTEALYDAGYSSSSRLYETAADRLGMTPATYVRGGATPKGEAVQISYTIVDSHLGRVLVGTTERGLCAISLGDDDAALEAELRREYPAADLLRDEGGLQAWAADLLRYLAGQQPRLDLPLDIQATAFQWQVWQALRSIPAGETRSYGAVARMIGQPTAARAVAQACASNRLAVVIPCHRVVREDGAAGGYRWGTARKEALLAQEAGQE